MTISTLLLVYVQYAPAVAAFFMKYVVYSVLVSEATSNEY